MLNEEKIKMMTKLALYEQGTGKKAIEANKYFKKDYVSMKMINTAFTITFAYILFVVLWFFFKVYYLMNKISNNDIFGMVRNIFILYFIVLLIYMLIAYVVYSMQYMKMQDMNKEYQENLKELYLLYKREEKNKNESKTGGLDFDDETFDF